MNAASPVPVQVQAPVPERVTDFDEGHSHYSPGVGDPIPGEKAYCGYIFYFGRAVEKRPLCPVCVGIMEANGIPYLTE